MSMKKLKSSIIRDVSQNNEKIIKSSIKCKKIGNYVLVKTIGRGTFGKVKIGIHLPTQKKVAIKILDKTKIKDETDVERISREIHILKQLRHMNIVQLYDTVTSNRHIYLVMEYVEGGDLYEYINSRKRLNENKACIVFQQMISSIEYIHKLGIVHRDIKPENILLDPKHEIIKLVDFGLSNSYEHGELINTACGSPCYAAPEMISGKPYYGLKSDIWSCGVVLFCMLCGYLPFDDNNIKKLYKKITEGDYRVPEFLSNQAKNLIKCILQTDPNKRYNIEQIKNHPWYNVTHQNLDTGIFIGVDEIHVDEDIVTKVKDLKLYRDNVKLSCDNISETIRKNTHNSITTAYYLLLQNKINLIIKSDDTDDEADFNNKSKKTKGSVSPHLVKKKDNSHSPKNIEHKNMKNNSPKNKKIINFNSPKKVYKVASPKVIQEKENTITSIMSSVSNVRGAIRNNSNTPNIRDTENIFHTPEEREGTEIASLDDSKKNNNVESNLNTINNIKTRTYIPTEINKSVNVVVINNIVADMMPQNDKKYSNQFDLNSHINIGDQLKNIGISLNKNNINLDRRKLNLSLKIGKNDINKLKNGTIKNFGTNPILKNNITPSKLIRNFNNLFINNNREDAKPKGIEDLYSTLNNNRDNSKLKDENKKGQIINVSNLNNFKKKDKPQLKSNSINKSKLEVVSSKTNSVLKYNNSKIGNDSQLNNSNTINSSNQIKNVAMMNNNYITTNTKNKKFIFISPDNSMSNLKELDDIQIQNSLEREKSVDKNMDNMDTDQNLNRKELTKNNKSNLSAQQGSNHTNINENNNEKINKKSNYINYHQFNHNLMKNKIGNKMANFSSVVPPNKIQNTKVQKVNIRTTSNSKDKNNSNYENYHISKLNKLNKLNPHPASQNHSKNKNGVQNSTNFKKLYDNESFNYEHSSIYNKNDNSLNISLIGKKKMDLSSQMNTYNKVIDLSMSGILNENSNTGLIKSLKSSNNSELRNNSAKDQKNNLLNVDGKTIGILNHVSTTESIVNTYENNDTIVNEMRNIEHTTNKKNQINNSNKIYQPGFLKSNINNRGVNINNAYSKGIESGMSRNHNNLSLNKSKLIGIMGKTNIYNESINSNSFLSNIYTPGVKGKKF